MKAPHIPTPTGVQGFLLPIAPCVHAARAAGTSWFDLGTEAARGVAALREAGRVGGGGAVKMAATIGLLA